MSSPKRLFLCQELIDVIVDYAHNDFDTLLSCSLASRHFVPSSRYHLFERMRLLSSQWTDFFDIIESPLSTITRVRIARADFKNQSQDLRSIMTRLQNLRPHSLSLANIQLEQSLDLCWETTGFSDLTRLTIIRSLFSNPFHLIDMISRLGALKHLCLFHLYFHSSKTVEPSSGYDHHIMGRKPTVPLLRTFELHFSSCVPEILALTQTQLDISALHTVALTPLYSKSLAPVGKFLRVLGPLLIHLELQLGTNVDTEQIEKHFNLSFNNNLQRIHILLPDYIGVMRIDAARSLALLSYALLLSQITSTSMCQVILSNGDGSGDRTIRLSQLPKVVLALKGKQFTHVQKVMFPPFGWGHLLKAKEYLETELRGWQHRGILAFQHVPGYYDRLPDA